MRAYTTQILPPFDFSQALALPLTQRLHHIVRVAKMIVDPGYQAIHEFPCVPDEGATEAEIHRLESELGIGLPVEYQEFLLHCRYLKLADGLEVGGMPFKGEYVTESPWIFDQNQLNRSFLVFASYWQYADGDQMMIDLEDPSNPVVVYLHEHGPLFELYAPSFSLALWRLVYET